MKNLFFKTLFTLAVFSLCVSFYSCEKETYNPKQKINKIYSEMLPYFPKHLSQEWFWESNKLARIDYYFGDNVGNTERYTYEKNKLVKVEDDDGFFIISYDGNKYKKIEYFHSYINFSYCTWDFSYTNNKISKIIYTETSQFLFFNKMETGFLSTLIPKEFISVLAEKSAKKGTEKSLDLYVCTFNYSYDGDNIKEIIMAEEYEGELFTITYTYISYDKMLNPFYKYVGLAPELISATFVTPKNNPLEVKIIYSEDNEQQLLEYSYQYEKKFPVEVEIKRTLVDENFSYSSKEYYEYQ